MAVMKSVISQLLIKALVLQILNEFHRIVFFLDEKQNVCRSLQTQEEKLIAHLFGCNRNFSRIFPKLNNLEEDRIKIKLKITVRNIEEIVRLL